MSPSTTTFHLDLNHRTGEINGPRPSPLNIHKSSHNIHKPPVLPVFKNHHQNLQKQGPIIIYTHSPKVIHTKPKDFMALVQKLTGKRSSSVDETGRKQPKQKVLNEEHNESKSNSGLSEEIANIEFRVKENFDVCGETNEKNSFLADIPLFTPNSGDLFCSPNQQRHYISPGKGNLISPSFMEFLKGFSDC